MTPADRGRETPTSHRTDMLLIATGAILAAVGIVESFSEHSEVSLLGLGGIALVLVGLKGKQSER